MNETGTIIIVATIAAVMLDFGLMYLLRRVSDQDKNTPRVHFLGAYSPFLTWLRYRRLPRIQLNIPRFWPHWPKASVGLGLALLLAVISQWLLLKHSREPGWPLLGYAAAALIFLWICWKILPPKPTASFAAVLPQPQVKRATAAVVLLVLSAAVSVVTVQGIDRGHTGSKDYVLAFTWGLSILLFIAGILVLAQWRWPSRVTLSAWWRNNWQEVLIILGLGVAAFAVRVIDLPWLPYAMINDEGEVGKAALAILSGLTSNLFKTGWSSQPVWSFVPNAIMVTLLGNSLTAIRLVSVIEGTLAVVCLYLLAREAFGRAVALLAAVGLVGLAWHIHFSRLGVHNVIDSLFATAVLWLTYRALRRGHLNDYLWAGLITGLTVYAYVGSRLVFALALGLLAFSWLRRTVRLRTHALHLLIFLGAAAVVAGPMLAHFIRHPDEFMGRTNAVNLLIGGRLELQAQASGQSIAAELLSQFTRSTLVYVTGQAPAQFFNSPRPYLPSMAAVFLILGLAYTTWRAREPRFMAIILWLWMVVIFGSTLTSSPPSNQRLIMSAPAITLLAAIGLWQTARLAHQLGVLPYRAGLALSLVVMCLSSIQGVAFYFGEYRQGHFFENQAEAFEYEVALAAQALGPDYRLFVIGLPTLTTGAANFGYLAADIEKIDFNTVTPETLAVLPHDKGALYAAIPRRLSDLEKVARWIPGGKWMNVPRRFQPEQIAYYAYMVRPTATKPPTLTPSPTFDPYERTVDSPDGKFSAKLRINWDDLNEKPVIELWDKAGSMLWKVDYQYPKVSPHSIMTIYRWSPDSSKVYFYYLYSYAVWYTIFKGSDLQLLDAYTGEIKDVVSGCCVDFVFSSDMNKIAYTSGDKVGILDLVTGTDKSVDILSHNFEQSGRIFFSPSGDKVIFHTLSNFNGTSIFLDIRTMKQKIIMDDYLIVDYDFDGWTLDENPRYRKGKDVFVIDLDTLSQTVIGTVTPQP